MAAVDAMDFCVEEFLLDKSGILPWVYQSFFERQVKREHSLLGSNVPIEVVKRQVWSDLEKDLSQSILQLIDQMERPLIDYADCEGLITGLLLSWLDRLFSVRKKHKGKIRDGAGRLASALIQAHKDPAKYKVWQRDLYLRKLESTLGPEKSLDQWQYEIQQNYHHQAQQEEERLLEAQKHFYTKSSGLVGEEARKAQWQDKAQRIIAGKDPCDILATLKAAKYGDLAFLKHCLGQGWWADATLIDPERTYDYARKWNQLDILHWMETNFDIGE